MKEVFDTLTLDLVDETVKTDEEILYSYLAVHKLLTKVKEAARVGLEYQHFVEDEDIQGIIYLKFRREDEIKTPAKKK